MDFFTIILLGLLNFTAAYNKVCKKISDYASIENNSNCWINPNLYVDSVEIPKVHGFPIEKYYVTSKDGYVLQLFRIPNNGSDSDRLRIPVLLQHGISVNGVSWFIFSVDSPAFILSNYGYDVWISNSRGTRYSMGHTKWKTYQKNYWDFSFHEMGIYDLPVILEFITAKTNQKVVFMGHSMGSTIGYVYASMLPDHSKKHLSKMITMAPAVFQKNIGVIHEGLLSLDPYFKILNDYGIYNFAAFASSFKNVCEFPPLLSFCSLGTAIFFGGNPYNLKPEIIPLGLKEFPDGFSWKCLWHYVNNHRLNGGFYLYDYGKDRNMKIYQQESPPKYDISRIDVPTSIYYAEYDEFVMENGVLRLFNELTCDKNITKIPKIDHTGFVYGDAVINIYKKIKNDIDVI